VTSWKETNLQRYWTVRFRDVRSLSAPLGPEQAELGCRRSGNLRLGLAKLQNGRTPAAHNDDDTDDLKKRDRDILIAAQIAEAMTVTTYSNIINIAQLLYTACLDDQGYSHGGKAGGDVALQFLHG
jgi:hypothetical protein